MFMFIFLKYYIFFFSFFHVSLSFFKFTAHLCWFMHLYPYPGFTILNTQDVCTFSSPGCCSLSSPAAHLPLVCAVMKMFRDASAPDNSERLIRHLQRQDDKEVDNVLEVSGIPCTYLAAPLPRPQSSPPLLSLLIMPNACVVSTVAPPGAHTQMRKISAHPTAVSCGRVCNEPSLTPDPQIVIWRKMLAKRFWCCSPSTMVTWVIVLLNDWRRRRRIWGRSDINPPGVLVRSRPVQKVLRKWKIQVEIKRVEVEAERVLSPNDKFWATLCESVKVSQCCS